MGLWSLLFVSFEHPSPLPPLAPLFLPLPPASCLPSCPTRPNQQTDHPLCGEGVAQANRLHQMWNADPEAVRQPICCYAMR